MTIYLTTYIPVLPFKITSFYFSIFFTLMIIKKRVSCWAGSLPLLDIYSSPMITKILNLLLYFLCGASVLQIANMCLRLAYVWLSCMWVPKKRVLWCICCWYICKWMHDDPLQNDHLLKLNFFFRLYLFS